MSARAARLRVSWLGLAVLSMAATATPAGAEEPGPEAVLAELPFLDALPNQIKIDLGTPGSRGLPLLLDTGAVQSFATAGAARELGISLRRNKQTPYRRETRLGPALDLVVDTRRGETASARGGDYALVGAPFLARFVVEIDFPRRRVRFLDPEIYQVPEADPAAFVLPLRPGSALPIVEITVGETRVPAVISTGVPGTLILPGGWAKLDPSAVAIDAEATARLELPPGGETMQAAVAKRVRVGGFEERDLPLLVAPQGLWDQGPRSAASLGVDFLKRFVLRIDVRHGRLWIRDPSVDTEKTPVSEPTVLPQRERQETRTTGVG